VLFRSAVPATTPPLDPLARDVARAVGRETGPEADELLIDLIVDSAGRPWIIDVAAALPEAARDQRQAERLIGAALRLANGPEAPAVVPPESPARPPANGQKDA
jgi:hypothetical protein